MKKIILIFKNLILRRILNRIKYIFYLKEIIFWKYESCDRCGHCFKLCWSAKDDIWMKVMNTDNGCLCIDCFVEIAKNKNIYISNKDIERIDIFNPKE